MATPDRRILLCRMARPAFFCCLSAVLFLAWEPHQAFGASSDVVNHAFAFFTLCALAGIGWPARPLWQLLPVLLALGGLIEIVQSFIGRDASWHDMQSDLLGLALAAAPLSLWRRRMRLPD